MSLEERLALLEKDVTTLKDAWEQLARDFELVTVNVSRAFKGGKKSQEKREWTWNPDKIAWTRDEGFKGPYEKSEDVNSLEFKAMLKDLQEHKGKLNRDGRFYWIFQNGSTVGRTMPK